MKSRAYFQIRGSMKIKINDMKIVMAHHIMKPLTNITAIKCLERHEKVDAIQLMYLRRIRDVAALKKYVFSKQKDNIKLF